MTTNFDPVYPALAAIVRRPARTRYATEYDAILDVAAGLEEQIKLRYGGRNNYGLAAALETAHALGRFINALPEPKRAALCRYMENQR